MRAEYRNSGNERKRAQTIFWIRRFRSSWRCRAHFNAQSVVREPFVEQFRLQSSNAAVREYNVSRVTWPCEFVEMFFRELQCNAQWLPRYCTNNVEFSNAPVRCLRIEIADYFGKKIQSKWLIYLLIGELSNDEVLYFPVVFNRSNRRANIITPIEKHCKRRIYRYNNSNTIRNSK